MFCHRGEKQSSFHCELILQSVRGGGKGLTNLSYWGSPTHLWPEWGNRKLCQTPPLKHPLFFYNPLLLSLSLCMGLKEPVNAPTPAEAVVNCWWNSAQQPLTHLFSFNFLSRGMRGQKEHKLSGFSPFLNRLSLTQICLFSLLCICILSHRKHGFV